MENNFLENLKIENFKSIKNLNINPNRVNVFIGPPNVGKSNILEAMGLLSALSSKKNSIRKFVRLNSYSNLFYDGEINSQIRIQVNDQIMTLQYENEKFIIMSNEVNLHSILDDDYNPSLIDEYKNNKHFGNKNSNYTEINFQKTNILFNKIKMYRYKDLDKYRKGSLQVLETPFGNNLLTVIYNNKKLRSIASDIVKEFNFQIQFRTDNNEIQIVKIKDGVNIAFPLNLSADTLRTMIFYNIAIASNENSILLFEEPETHTFPFYSQSIAEKIAMDQTNQYFITTHNPYFLETLLDKTNKDEISVFHVYQRKYETKVNHLSMNDLDYLRIGDPFFSLDRLEVKN